MSPRYAWHQNERADAKPGAFHRGESGRDVKTQLRGGARGIHAARPVPVAEKHPQFLKRIRYNGSEYLGEFTQRAGRLGIAHFFSYPHCPKHNTLVERPIQTEIEESHMHVDVRCDLEESKDHVVACGHYYN